jgi:glyoxylase-like metal-dependent hydrolase (beta-lactamase superfamily II)
MAQAAAIARVVPLALAAVALAAWPAVSSAQSALEVLPVQGNVFMIAGPGGNMTVQIGDEAVVLVDTMTEAVSSEVLDAIEGLSEQPIRHIILTSDEPDHTGGNAALSHAGTYVRLMFPGDPRGFSSEASINAYINVLHRMSGVYGEAFERPFPAQPSDTYFTDDWAFFVNGEAIRMLHVPAAHTDGDTIVFFRRSDVISTGDIFRTDGYPHFDRARGGSIGGVIEGLNTILDLAIPGEHQEGGTVVVPGHGRLSDETDVVNYRDMVTIIRDRIQAMIDAGMTLEQVQAARPSRDYDGIYAAEPEGARAAIFVENVYRDLTGDER